MTAEILGLVALELKTSPFLAQRRLKAEDPRALEALAVTLSWEETGIHFETSRRSRAITPAERERMFGKPKKTRKPKEPKGRPAGVLWSKTSY